MWHGIDYFCIPQFSHQTRTSIQTDAERLGAVGDDGGGCGVEDHPQVGDDFKPLESVGLKWGTNCPPVDISY